MKRVIKNGFLFLGLPQGDILSAGFTIMGLSLVSGIFGLIRSRLLTTYFTDDLRGIYFAAFVIPDNLFQILVVSALGAAFIPVFTKYQKRSEHWEFSQSLLSISLTIFILLIIVAFIFIEPLASLSAAGIEKENPAHLALFTNLTRIILFAQIFFVVSFFCTAILQANLRFIIPASAPILYNLGTIGGIIFLAPTIGMYGVAIGIVIGALLHLAIQVPFLLRLNFPLHLKGPFIHPGIKEVVHLMGPRALSLAIERLKVTIDTNLSSLISIASIGFLNFATQVAIFPVSLFASAIGQAALPFLVKAASDGNMEEFKKHVVMSITHIAFFLTPVSVLLVVLHTPLVRLTFGGKFFSWEATLLTSQTLSFLAIGLFAQGANTLLARAFYALFDTKTPLVMTILSTVVSIILSIIFVLLFSLPVWSIGLATTIGAFINALLLFVLLDKKVGGFPRFSLSLSLGKILLIGIFLGIFSYTLFKTLERFFDTDYGLPLLIFTLIVVLASGLFYLFLSFIFNLDEYKAIFQFFKKARKIREQFLQETNV